MTHLVIGNALAVGAMMTLLWGVSVARRDASVVDPFWSIGLLLVTLRTALVTGFTLPKAVLVGATALWALRLFLHLFVRSLGHGEDPRYQAFRRHYGPERYWWVSFFQVFVLQGVLMLIVSSALQVGAASPDARFDAWDVMGLVVFAAGFVVEAVADAQLTRFRRAFPSGGPVLDTGLFRYSRHPNYFGESVVHFGLAMMVLDDPLGWPALLGPALMLFLLLRVSGVTLLEKHMSRTRPGYAEYARRTSAFVPWPPRPA